MSKEKTDLLDDLLEIQGEEPAELLVGGHDLWIRRSYTGAEILEWQKIEMDRVERNRVILASTVSEDEKTKALTQNGYGYLVKMMKFICVEPTTEKSIDAVCELLKSTTSQVFNKVTARIFQESGLFDEEGRHVPFQQPSRTETAAVD